MSAANTKAARTLARPAAQRNFHPDSHSTSIADLSNFEQVAKARLRDAVNTLGLSYSSSVAVVAACDSYANARALRLKAEADKVSHGHQ